MSLTCYLTAQTNLVMFPHTLLMHERGKREKRHVDLIKRLPGGGVVVEERQTRNERGARRGAAPTTASDSIGFRKGDDIDDTTTHRRLPR